MVLSILCGAWVVLPILCEGLGSFCLFCVGFLVVLSILCGGLGVFIYSVWCLGSFIYSVWGSR